MAEKTRYTDEELEEFRGIILEKIEAAQHEYDTLCRTLTNSDGNDTADTSPTFKVLEEGAYTLGKEEAARLAERQRQFVAGEPFDDHFRYGDSADFGPHPQGAPAHSAPRHAVGRR